MEIQEVHDDHDFLPKMMCSNIKKYMAAGKANPTMK